MTHGSLFSGIGGFDLAAQWMGWENLFHCEWNEFGQKVLKYYWPDAESFNDITKSNFTKYHGAIDILSGGFPCQPYSTAGKRLGKDDERHLWPHMLRAIREIQPTWVVGENVSGLISWNAGLVFNEVQLDLEAAGYEVIPFVLPACGVNAPHRRDRIWFIARNANGTNQGTTNGGTNQAAAGKVWWQQKSNVPESSDCDGVAQNTDSNGCVSSEWQSQSNKWGQRDVGAGDYEQLPTNDAEIGITADAANGRCKPGQIYNRWCNEKTFTIKVPNVVSDTSKSWIATNSSSSESQGGQQHGGIGKERQAEGESRQLSRPIPSAWQEFPTQPPICGRNDGLPVELDGITFSKWRNETIKAYGNAIVPQVAFQIFKAIEEFETMSATANPLE